MPCSELGKRPNNGGGGGFFFFLKNQFMGALFIFSMGALEHFFFFFVHREIFKQSHLWFLGFPKSEITKMLM